MVLDNSGRHFGGMSFEPMYPNTMHAPQFSDPWSHQNTSNGQQYPSMSKPETSRPALSMPYSQMPPVSAPLSSGSHYSSLGYQGEDVLSVGQDIPRSTYPEQPTYSAPSSTTSNYATAYPSMNYAQSLAQQQHHQAQQQQHQRKISER